MNSMLATRLAMITGGPTNSGSGAGLGFDSGLAFWLRRCRRGDTRSRRHFGCFGGCRRLRNNGRYGR